MLIAHNWYRSSLPSGENDIVRINIEHLIGAGIEVKLLERNSDSIMPRDLSSVAKTAISPIYSRDSVKEFRALVERWRPDVVHVHNLFPLLSPMIVREAQTREIPVVMTLHNYRIVCIKGDLYRDGVECKQCVGKSIGWPAIVHGCYQGSRVRSVPIVASNVFHRQAWLGLTRYLVLSDEMGALLTQIGVKASSISRISNHVEIPERVPPMGSGFIYAGRLSEEKGVDILLRSWEKVEKRLDSRLTIAGDGPLRGEVISAAGRDSSIRYIGLVDQSVIKHEISDHAMAILHTHAEQHSVFGAIAESLGRHVLTKSGIAEMESGAFTADGSREAWGLAQAIDYFIDHPNEALRLGHVARDRLVMRQEREPSLADLLIDVIDGASSA